MGLRKKLLSVFLAGALIGGELSGIFGINASAYPVHTQVQKDAKEAAQTGREILNFNSGWGFFRGDLEGAQAPDYDDSSFASVTVPHTMRLEKKHCSGSNSTYKGIGWYRRYFTLGEAYRGKKINIDFEGVMLDSEIYLNGEQVYERNGGYVEFSVDLSDKIKFGETNVLAVRVSNVDNLDTPPGRVENNLDFHYYGGIYRDVSLRITEPLYISDTLQANREAGGGVFVTYPQVSEEEAEVLVKTDVVNETGNDARFAVRHTLKAPDGQTVASVSSGADTLSDGQNEQVSQTLSVSEPELWHPKDPNLYCLQTDILLEGEVVDSVSEKIGIRTIDYRPDGFYINGKKLYLRGANRHQSFQNVGDAAPNSMQRRDAILLKESGFNAVRAAHYPQDPAFLDACDEIGLLVVECQPGWQNFTPSQTFYDRTIRDTREMVRRDRNHPSVILWEASLNETGIPGAYASWYEEATGAAHAEYPGDQFFTANDYGFRGDLYDVCYKVQDTQWSQDPSEWKDFDPQKPFFTREWGDFEGASKALRKEGTDAMNTQVLTRQRYLNGDGYSDWGGLDASGRIGGHFLWSFNDYTRGSNSKTLGSGTVDIDRYEKNCFYWLKSMQSAKDPDYGPMVFISGDYTEDAGKDILVFSNCDSVKLYQNGRPVGEIQREEALKTVPNIASKGGSPIFTFHLDRFEKGSLTAEGIVDRTAVVTHEVKTPETAARFEVEIREKGIRPIADGSDLIPVYIKAVDQNGTVIPNYTGQVHIDVSGEGELVGKDIPRIKAEDQVLENGIGFVFVRTTGTSGKVFITASADGMENGTAVTETETFTGTFVPEADHAAWEGGMEKLEEEQVKNLASGKPVTASSQQSENGNFAENAVDDDEGTRWCASGSSLPQWLSVDLGARYAVSGFQILWENANAVYQYTIETSDDGENWNTVVDQSDNSKVNGGRDIQAAPALGRYFRLNVSGISNGWASLYEFIIQENPDIPEVDPGSVILDDRIALITATGGEVENRGTDKLRDGDTVIGSGWLSASKEFPQSVTVEFTEPHTLLGSRIYWEKDSSWYTYSLEVSKDAENWETAIDHLTVGGQHYKAETFAEKRPDVRFVKVTIHNIEAGGDYQIGMAEWMLYGSPTVRPPMKEFDYASDIDWESARTDYGSVKKDEAAYGGKQTLHSEYGDLVFDKGIGTDTNSEVVYDVANKGYTAFSSYIGINANASKQGGEAVFQIYADDSLLYESDVKMRDDYCDFVNVDITGASKVTLVTKWSENPDNPEARYNTHTNWSDAKFYYGSQERVALRVLCDREDRMQRDKDAYTLRSFYTYQAALAQALAVLTDEESTDAVLKKCRETLEESIRGLILYASLSPEERMEELIARAEDIKKQAEVEKEAAELAKGEAQKAQEDAEAAKKEAEQAKKEAEEALKKAQEAQGNSETAKQEAEQAQKKAEEAQRKAQEAQDKAEKAKKEAEEAQQKAQASAEDSRRLQQEAKLAKEEAEAAKETAKQAEEAARKEKEEAEAARKAAKQAEEAAKAAMEEARRAKEEASRLLAASKQAEKAAEQSAERAQFVAQGTKIKKLFAGKKKLSLTLKKTDGADGYEVQYSLKPNFKKAAKKTTAGSQLTIKKLKSKKNYYVRVRAYKLFDGKKVYTSFSAKESVKTK